MRKHKLKFYSRFWFDGEYVMTTNRKRGIHYGQKGKLPQSEWHIESGEE